MPPKGNAPPVAHFEVGGSDAPALAEFYTGMFDWQIHYHEEANYRLIQQESGGIGGGIFQHTEDMRPTILPSPLLSMTCKRISTRP